MASVLSCLDIPEADLRPKLDPGIWVEPKDKDPASEDTRQVRVVNRMKRDHRDIAVHAVPNGGRQSDWARIRAEKMGVVAGQPDLEFNWIGGGGLVEMKDGEGNPSRAQIERLNQLYRMGKNVAICRTPEGVMGRLRVWGAPV